MKNIVLFGTGILGKRYFPRLIELFDVNVIGYSDNNEAVWGKELFGKIIVPPRDILSLQYDEILIAISTIDGGGEIKRQLSSYGIPIEKVIDIRTSAEYMILDADQRINFMRGCSRWVYDNNIKGSVAECGVFRGDSAKFINKFFHDRKLYLFDTFEGFDDRDVVFEKEMGNQSFLKSEFADGELFDNTNISNVLNKMTYRDNVIIKKGYFPESAEKVEDSFCFVNLDMDLYKPMLAGMRFFWSRMAKNGIVLLHDYYHPELPGVKDALCDFEKELGYSISKMPIGDGCSMAVIKNT